MIKVVIMNSKQEQRICKVTSVIFVLDTLWKNIFSRLDLLVFFGLFKHN